MTPAEDARPLRVRVHGGRVDHHARQERPGRWRTACQARPVRADDSTRPLCGTPCACCARVLAEEAAPAAAAARAHPRALQRQEAAEKPSLPDGTPLLAGTAPAAQPSSADLPAGATDSEHDRRVRARLTELAARRGGTAEEVLQQLNAYLAAGEPPVPRAPAAPETGPAAREGSPRVVAQRPADDTWGVIGVAYDGPPAAPRRPCGGTEPCPWRRDAPRGQFPPQAFIHSAPGNRTGGPMGRFGCHSSTPARPLLCAGWLLAGADGNPQVLDLLRSGTLPLPELPDGMQVYGSYAEMAVANGVDPALPALYPGREPACGEENFVPMNAFKEDQEPSPSGSDDRQSV
ncbi:DUF6283 family protein [Streptomyces sp. Tu 3180]|uniref:DUF6283 family protein n=1 Tax=Streptomyces sp. Tu 3180 TaxID=2682611 RepID=UPI00135CA27A|nr:DUF6283 family protein [Streptomyces sp. Tu 3180]KAF3463234.1 hypothetical protein GL259_01675 [Streptomyces sp. Tu 3180]